MQCSNSGSNQAQTMCRPFEIGLNSMMSESKVERCTSSSQVVKARTFCLAGLFLAPFLKAIKLHAIHFEDHDCFDKVTCSSTLATSA